MLIFLGSLKGGHLHVIKYLIEHGADVNFVSDDGQSSLCKAVEERNLDLVELLVANGADVNQRLAWLEEGTVLNQASSVKNENYNKILFLSILSSLMHCYRMVILESSSIWLKKAQTCRFATIMDTHHLTLPLRLVLT